MLRRLQPLVSLLLLTAALAACAVPGSAATPTPEPGRVRIDELGLSLILPDGWGLAGPFPVESTGTSYSLYALGLNPGASGGPGSSQIIVADAALLTVEAFVAAQCTTCPTNPWAETQIGGLPARRTQVGGGGVPFSVDWVFVDHDGKLIGFSIRDPETLAPLENALQSIRFDDGAAP